MNLFNLHAEGSVDAPPVPADTCGCMCLSYFLNYVRFADCFCSSVPHLGLLFTFPLSHEMSFLSASPLSASSSSSDPLFWLLSPRLPPTHMFNSSFHSVCSPVTQQTRWFFCVLSRLWVFFSVSLEGTTHFTFHQSVGGWWFRWHWPSKQNHMCYCMMRPPAVRLNENRWVSALWLCSGSWPRLRRLLLKIVDECRRPQCPWSQTEPAKGRTRRGWMRWSNGARPWPLYWKAVSDFLFLLKSSRSWWPRSHCPANVEENNITTQKPCKLTPSHFLLNR